MKKRKLYFLKLGILFFGISLLLYNCTFEENTLEPEKINFSNINTVSFKDAIAHFNTKNEKIQKRNAYAKSTKNTIEVTPDWNTLKHNEIAYTEAQITTANSQINRKGNYFTELYFINVNNRIKNVIVTVWEDQIDSNGKLINGRVFFNDLEGKFIDGYSIENGIFTKRYVVKQQPQQAGFFPLLFIQSLTQAEDDDCWNTDTLGEFDGGVLDEVSLTLSGGSSSGGSSHYSSGWSYYRSDYGDYINGATLWNSLPTGGGGSLSSGQINSAAAAILIAAPVRPDEDGECPNGYVLNSTTNECESICKQEGRTYNTITEKCDCPLGQVEDKDGNCVKKPCKGDPVANVEIAPSKLGKKGGTFGCTRKELTETCGGVRGNKKHDGLDVKAAVNTNTFSMYDGKVSDIRNSFSPGEYKDGSYGNYILVTTKINGETVYIKYNHLNEVHVKKGDIIKAGDIIGLNGNTGNANPPDDKIVPHIHLQVFNTKWGSLNPFNFLTTKFDNQFNPISNKCN